MNRQPARVLEPGDLCRLLAQVDGSRHQTRNIALILLSYKAGLRACEMAGLTWPMVLNSNGKIAERITITGNIAKYGRARTIPMHRLLRDALQRLNAAMGRPKIGSVIISQRGSAMTARSVVNWFSQLYFDLELFGYSSHSGRRTFITQGARNIFKAGGSLRDIQELAGHRALSTTERYIEGNREAQRKLISLP